MTFINSNENCTLRIVQTFDYPISILWDAFSLPEQIVHWWGPEGFTNTIHTMNFQEGGEWKMTMHGPDGTNYPNRSIYKEILPQKKIVFEHFNPHFITTIQFEEIDNGVRVNWSMLFDSEEMYAIIVKAHKADEGLKQNLQRLALYLT